MQIYKKHIFLDFRCFLLFLDFFQNFYQIGGSKIGYQHSTTQQTDCNLPMAWSMRLMQWAAQGDQNIEGNSSINNLLAAT